MKRALDYIANVAAQSCTPPVAPVTIDAAIDAAWQAWIPLNNALGMEHDAAVERFEAAIRELYRAAKRAESGKEAT